MKSIVEFLSTKVDKDTIEKVKDSNDVGLSLNPDLIKKFKFEFKTLRTGNIEAVSKTAKYHGSTGMRFMFYLYNKSGKYVLRRQYAINNPWNSVIGWSNPPAHMGEFDTIEDMCDKFNKWVEKNLTI